MPPRFYCPEFSGIGHASLTGTESHHAAHVLRLKVGEQIELFDGRGLVGTATIEQIQKHDLLCEVRHIHQAARSTPEVILATAVPKGERFDWLVEKATELGVVRLIPLVTAHSSVDPRDSKLDRLRQTIIAACKQCRRPYLMELDAVTAWDSFLEGLGDGLFVAHPAGLPMPDLAIEQDLKSARRWVFAVGPEGGFSEPEIAAAVDRGGRLVNIGPYILRVETAGLAAAAWGLVQQVVHQRS